MAVAISRPLKPVCNHFRQIQRGEEKPSPRNDATYPEAPTITRQGRHGPTQSQSS